MDNKGNNRVMDYRVIYSNDNTFENDFDNESKFVKSLDGKYIYVMDFDMYGRIEGEKVVVRDIVREMVGSSILEEDLLYVMIISEDYAILVMPNVDNIYDKLNYLLKMSSITGGDQIYTVGEYLIKGIIE